MTGDAARTELTATEAGLLGLLSIDSWPRPWTSYELAKQAGRSIGWFWPRAQRQFIRLPRQLVERGFAEAHDHPTGRRAGTRYTITDAGRGALQQWLRHTAGSITIEGENLIRVFFAERMGAAGLRATLTAIADSVAEDRARLATIAAHQDITRDSDRAAVNALTIRLVSDVHDTIARWAQWALAETEGWADPRDPWPAAEQVFDEVIAAGRIDPKK